MASGTSSRPRVAVIADTDSRWKWGIATAKTLEDPQLQYFLIETSATPNERQFKEAGVDPSQVVPVTIADLPGTLARYESDVALVSLPGGACQAVLHAMASAPAANRPIVITGYVGVVYEKIVEGLLLRGGSDIVLANSPSDARNFRDFYAEYGADPGSVIESALAYLAKVAASTEPHPYTVTFAAQPGVPETEKSRRYVVDRLIQHARLHPEREVILKLRGLPGERVTHPEPYPYSRMVEQRQDDLPSNFSMVGGPMGKVLARTNLMVTISSTAAVEAIQNDIPTAILTDFGVNDQLGTPYYAGSGCLASFDDLDEGAEPLADRNWAVDHGLLKLEKDALRERVDELLAQRPLPDIKPFYTLHNATFYLPRLLASYGLDPHGQALVQTRVKRSRLIRVVRRTSRRAYRYGANVVAPLLRKLGSL